MSKVLAEAVAQLQIMGISNGDATVKVLMKDENGDALIATGTTVPSAKTGYAKGGAFIKTDAATKVRSIYENTGTKTSCVFVQSGTVGGKSYFTVAKNTNGVTPVNVFGTGGAPCALTVTSVVSIAMDATAGNIVLKQAANTVATIAKGAVAGVLVGAASLANAIYAASDVCTIESSSAGNSTVQISFEV